MNAHTNLFRLSAASIELSLLLIRISQHKTDDNAGLLCQAMMHIEDARKLIDAEISMIEGSHDVLPMHTR